MSNIITPIGYSTPMTYHTLHQMYGAENIRHMGNKVVVITPDYVIGYTVDSYDGYTPDLLSDKTYTDRRNVDFGNWDAVYDFLYGAPTGAPDFTKALNV